MLNGDDMLCLKMAAHTEADRIAYFTMNPKHPLVRQHIQNGGLAVVLEEGINGQMVTFITRCPSRSSGHTYPGDHGGQGDP